MTGEQREIIKLCIRKGACSIADFSKTLSISVPTATKIVTKLIDDGFLQDCRERGLAGCGEDQPLRVLPVLAQRGRRGRAQVSADADLPAAGAA